MSRTARLGLFICSAIMILSASLFMLGNQQFLFSSTYSLQASFDSVSGLAEGAEVRIGGVRKGIVASIRMPQRPGGKIVVAMKLDKSTRQFIKKDSIASIETAGLLGNKFMEISFGSKDAPFVSNSDSIQSSPPIDLSDMIKKTNEILDTTNAALKNVNGATADLNNITAKVDRGEGTVGALINDKTMYNQLNATAADVRKTVEQAKIGVTGFQEDMEALKHNWFFHGFFKNRGYMDSAELTKYEIATIPKTPAMKEFFINSSEVFNGSGSKLEHGARLSAIGEFLQNNPFGLVVVAACTGMRGDSIEQLTRSRARAVAVRQYLVENFKLDDLRIKTKGMGKQAQNAAGSADLVEILVYSAKPERSLRAGK